MGGPQSVADVSCTSSSSFTKLRYFLDHRGVRLSFVAGKAGIEYNRFCRLCSGVNEPTLREALALKRVLVCELNEIFDTDEAMPGNGSDHD